MHPGVLGQGGLGTWYCWPPVHASDWVLEAPGWPSACSRLGVGSRWTRTIMGWSNYWGCATYWLGHYGRVALAFSGLTVLVCTTGWHCANCLAHTCGSTGQASTMLWSPLPQAAALIAACCPENPRLLCGSKSLHQPARGSWAPTVHGGMLEQKAHGSGVRKPSSEFLPCSQPAVWPWAQHLTFLCLCCLLGS